MADYRVLVTAPAWIGDMVMAQSLFISLRQQYPGSAIDVLAPSWTLPVVERMQQVRRGIPFPVRHGRLDLILRYRIGKGLRAERYDEAIIMPRSFKSALPSFFATIPKRTGHQSHLGLINNVRPYRRDRDELFVRRHLSLLLDDAYVIDAADIPRPVLRIEHDAQAALLKRFRLEKGRYVVFAPGAEFGPAKQWPLEHFSALADSLAAQGLSVVVMGSAKEIELGGRISELVESARVDNLCGKTQLSDVIDLMNAAHTVVSNDSGLMHLGYAAGVRVIAIYGSSSPGYTPPLSDNAVVLQQSLDCQPCFQRTCRFGHYDCLHRISAEQVVAHF